MRAIAIVTALSLGACITITSKKIGPGVLREDWAEPRRDPDPTLNPAIEQTGNPWVEEDPSAPEPPKSERRELAEKSAATILAVIAGGWTPLLVLSGTFEETPTAGSPR